MYSKIKVAERLALAQPDLKFPLERHSVSEIISFDSHLTSKGMILYNDSGQPSGTQNLTQFEVDWMENERILVMSDAEYALTRYCFLKDQENIVRRFEFRVPQRILFDIIADLEESNRTLEFVILKARQLGCSTLVELLIGLRIIFGYGVNAVIGSADQTKTALMANMLFLLYDMLPIWLRPSPTRRVQSDRGMLVFGQNLSGVSFQHGAQMSGIARGTTPTIYHLSEVASFTDAENQIESSLFRAVHPSPSVFGILESSGEGDKGWWPDKWRSSRDHWKHHKARHCPLFLPWFCGVEMYPKRQLITYDNPLPENWIPNAMTREHVAKCELYVRSNPLLEKHLLAEQAFRGMSPTKWNMPKEQQWFWEFGHEEARRNGPTTTAKWYQEMCADDNEALQRSATSIFGNDTIIEIDTARTKEYEMFAITGQSIEDDHEPPTEYIDYARERIPIRYSNLREETYRWDLVPLTFNPEPREDEPADATGILFIWHHPQPNVRYAIGVDTGGGLGEDSTSISVWALGSGDQPDVQVAEYTSAYVSHVESFAFVIAIAAYYKSQMNQESTGWREPYVTIEQLKAVGDVAQVQMAKMGYRNFHMFSRYDGKSPSEDKRRSRRKGWYTNTWSRPILLGYFVSWAKNKWVKINSPWLLEEMKHFEQKVTATGRYKMEHEDGAHDDRVFAASMGTFCPHDMDPMVSRSKKRSIQSSETLPQLDFRPYQSNTYSTKDLSRRESHVDTIEDILYDAEQMERYR